MGDRWEHGARILGAAAMLKKRRLQPPDHDQRGLSVGGHQINPGPTQRSLNLRVPGTTLASQN